MYQVSTFAATVVNGFAHDPSGGDHPIGISVLSSDDEANPTDILVSEDGRAALPDGSQGQYIVVGTPERAVSIFYQEK